MHNPVLSGYTLELVRNTNAVYQTVSLSGSVVSGGYFVICATGSTVANCNLKVTPVSGCGVSSGELGSLIRVGGLAGVVFGGKRRVAGCSTCPVLKVSDCFSFNRLVIVWILLSRIILRQLQQTHFTVLDNQRHNSHSWTTILTSNEVSPVIPSHPRVKGAPRNLHSSVFELDCIFVYSSLLCGL